jgi:hypothetical protein
VGIQSFPAKSSSLKSSRHSKSGVFPHPQKQKVLVEKAKTIIIKIRVIQNAIMIPCNREKKTLLVGDGLRVHMLVL